MCPEGAQVELSRERCVTKDLKLSFEVSECKPLRAGSPEQEATAYAATALNNLAHHGHGAAVVGAGGVEVWPTTYCLPRHPTHFEPSISYLVS
jgi:hypothetical protein